MRVLILSLDRALINKNSEGDTFERFIAYKKACEYLSVIVPMNTKEVVYEKNGIKVYPAFGQNNFLAYWHLGGLVKKVTRRERIDLVVANDAVMGAIAILVRGKERYKVQVNIFGLEIINPYWLKERPQNIFLKWVQEWAIKRADGIRADSQKGKEQVVQLYEVDPQRIVVVPVSPGQESQKRYLNAKTDPVIRQRLLGKKKFLILSVGSLVKAKDFPTLLRAAGVVVGKIPQAVFVIAGSGPEKEQIKKEIERMGLENQVKLLGSVAYQKLPRLFASADVFVLSSSHEGFPRVLMEAALVGAPIVSTKVDGAEEIIENQHSGFLVPVKDYRSLANKIVWLLKNNNRAWQMGIKAKRVARVKLNFQNAVKRIVASWRQLLNER